MYDRPVKHALQKNNLTALINIKHALGKKKKKIEDSCLDLTEPLTSHPSQKCEQMKAQSSNNN